MKKINTTDLVRRLSVRLGDLHWRWVQANRLFDTLEEIEVKYLALAYYKDRINCLHLAFASDIGWVHMRMGPGANVASVPLGELYVPLGFAYDVIEWRQKYGDATPLSQRVEPGEEWRPLVGFKVDRFLERNGVRDAILAPEQVTQQT